MPKLTEAMVKQAIKDGVPEGRDYILLWDDTIGGLAIKIRSTGTATWMLRYRPRGANKHSPARSLTLGRHPGVTLAAAQAAAKARLGEIARGDDPALELRAERNRERRLLAAALDSYEKDLTARRIVKTKDTMSTLRRGLAKLLNQELDRIERKDIVECIDALKAAGKTGGDLKKHSHTFLEWAVNSGLIKHNVMAGMRTQRASRAEKIEAEEYGRALSDEEIAKVWHAAGSQGVFGGIARLGLLTAMRRGELAGLRWSDVLEDKISLPAAHTKTGAAHDIPLTPAMRAVINAQVRQHGSPYVFGSQRAVGKKVSGWTKFQDALVKASGVDHRIHDWRRTARTLMSRAGIEDGIAELSIGHVRSDLERRYNRDEALAGRQKAFEAVSEHISKVIANSPGEPSGANAVVVMPKRKRKAA